MDVEEEIERNEQICQKSGKEAYDDMGFIMNRGVIEVTIRINEVVEGNMANMTDEL